MHGTCCLLECVLMHHECVSALQYERGHEWNSRQQGGKGGEARELETLKQRTRPRTARYGAQWQWQLAISSLPAVRPSGAVVQEGTGEDVKMVQLCGVERGAPWW